MVTVNIRISTSNDRACYPSQGYQTVYQAALEAGLRIPLHPFLIALLNYYQVGLGQIMPNSWCLVISFLILALQEKIAPSVELFNLFFNFASQPGKNSWYYFRGREGKSLIHNPVTSIKEWTNRFVFIKIEGLKRSWNFGYVAPSLKLKNEARNYKAEIWRI